MTGRDQEGDVVEQADALMRRYRSFVARAPEDGGETEPHGTAAPADEDIPVLTEIVAPDRQAGEAAAIDPAALRAIIADSLQRWIDEALLPQLLEKIEHGTRQKL